MQSPIDIMNTSISTADSTKPESIDTSVSS